MLSWGGFPIGCLSQGRRRELAKKGERCCLFAKCFGMRSRTAVTIALMVVGRAVDPDAESTPTAEHALAKPIEVVVNLLAGVSISFVIIHVSDACGCI